MRQFAGLSLARGPVPAETTILNFRHLREQHGLAREIFETVKARLHAAGLLLRQGMIVDATTIAASSSTKNSTGERDPEMRQARKGNQWSFGMLASMARAAPVHSVSGTAANVADMTRARQVLHGRETVAFDDAGYRRRATFRVQRRIVWRVATRPGQRRRLAAGQH
jgi:transposase, IS5 family